ncbi:MAG: pyruvate dehydrogenase complex dihydrolipoamide acetyltransferase [Alphaproteobacteria bacterium]|nr:MAG: pyruvate dehydrogenase complex dihydrolipoamide acetyltransferase [Alphaproteobacteria bacterium]
MPIEITMPALSPTMEKGTLAHWLVKEGDEVKAGDLIAEIETDKATMEVEAVEEGRIAKLLVPEGTEDIPVGQPIAVLLEEGEDSSALAGSDGERKAKEDGAHREERVEEEKAAAAVEIGGHRVTRKQDDAIGAVEKSSAPSPGPSQPAENRGAAGGSTPAPQGGRIFASPLARRMAAQLGVALETLKGSGPHGRIIAADVEAAAGRAAAAGAPAAAIAGGPAPSVVPKPAGEAFVPPADVPYEELRLSSMRKVIARRMTESKTQVPHFYLTIDVELDRLLAVRRELNERLSDEGLKISVNDFVIRASALALKQVPAANAMFSGDRILRFKRADISVAVAVEGGLVTPVVRAADSKGLAEIAREMKALADKARTGKLLPEDYQGGTFSISNLGMYGIKEFAAVINPPQGAILAVGQGEKRPVVRGDALAIATVMSCTLSVDHRALDGAIGAEFLSAFKRLIEDPLNMLL